MTKRELRGVFRKLASYALDVRGAAHGIWRFRAGRSEAMRASMRRSCTRQAERLALRSFVRFQFPDSGAQYIEFGLDLGHPFHLDFELAINVVEVGLHFFEDVIPLVRAFDTNRPFASGLANLSTTPDWPSGPPRALRPT